MTANGKRMEIIKTLIFLTFQTDERKNDRQNERYNIKVHLS